MNHNILFILLFSCSVFAYSLVKYSAKPLKDGILTLDDNKDIVQVTCNKQEMVITFKNSVLSTFSAKKLLTGGEKWNCLKKEPFYRKINKVKKTEGKVLTISTYEADKKDFFRDFYGFEACTDLLKDTKTKTLQKQIDTSIQKSKTVSNDATKFLNEYKKVGVDSKVKQVTNKIDELKKKCTTVERQYLSTVDLFKGHAKKTLKNSSYTCKFSDLEKSKKEIDDANKAITDYVAKIKKEQSDDLKKATAALKTLTDKSVKPVKEINDLITKANASLKNVKSNSSALKTKLDTITKDFRAAEKSLKITDVKQKNQVEAALKKLPNIKNDVNKVIKDIDAAIKDDSKITKDVDKAIAETETLLKKVKNSIAPVKAINKQSYDSFETLISQATKDLDAMKKKPKDKGALTKITGIKKILEKVQKDTKAELAKKKVTNIIDKALNKTSTAKTPLGKVINATLTTVKNGIANSDVTKAANEVKKILKQGALPMVQLRLKNKEEFKKLDDKKRLIEGSVNNATRTMNAETNPKNLEQIKKAKTEAEAFVKSVQDVLKKAKVKTIEPNNKGVISLAASVVKGVKCTSDSIVITFRSDVDFKAIVGTTLEGKKVLGCVGDKAKAADFKRKIIKITNSTLTSFSATTEVLENPSIFAKAFDKLTNNITLTVKPVDNVVTLHTFITKNVQCSGTKMTVTFSKDVKLEIAKGNVLKGVASLGCIDPKTNKKTDFYRRIVSISTQTKNSFTCESEITTKDSAKSNGMVVFTTEQQGTVNIASNQQVTFTLKTVDKDLRGKMVKISLEGTNKPFSVQKELDKNSEITRISFAPDKGISGKTVSVKIALGQKILVSSTKKFALNPPVSLTLDPAKSDAKYYKPDMIVVKWSPAQTKTGMKFELVHSNGEKVAITPESSGFTTTSASFKVEKLKSDFKSGTYTLNMIINSVTSQTSSFYVALTGSVGDRFRFVRPYGRENLNKDSKLEIEWDANGFKGNEEVKLKVCSDKNPILPGDSCVDVGKEKVSKKKLSWKITEKRQDTDYYVKAIFDCNGLFNMFCGEARSELFTLNTESKLTIKDPVIKGTTVTVGWDISGSAKDEEITVFLVDADKDDSKDSKKVKLNAKTISFDLGKGSPNIKRLSFRLVDKLFDKKYEYSKSFSIPYEFSVGHEFNFKLDINCDSCGKFFELKIDPKKGATVSFNGGSLIICPLCTLAKKKLGTFKDLSKKWKDIVFSKDAMKSAELLFKAKDKDPKEETMKELMKTLVSKAGLLIDVKKVKFFFGVKFSDFEWDGAIPKAFNMELVHEYALNVVFTLSFGTKKSSLGSGFTKIINQLSQDIKSTPINRQLGEILNEKGSLSGMRIPLFGPSIKTPEFPLLGKNACFGLGANIGLKFELGFSGSISFNYVVEGRKLYRASLVNGKYFTPPHVELSKKESGFKNIEIDCELKGSVSLDGNVYVSLLSWFHASLNVDFVKLELAVQFKIGFLQDPPSEDAGKCDRKYLTLIFTPKILYIEFQATIPCVSLTIASFKLEPFPFQPLEWCPF